MEWNAIGVRAPALSSFQIITQSDPIAPDLLKESRSCRQRNCLYLGLRDFGGFEPAEVSVLVLMSAGSGYAGRGGLLCYLGASHCDPGRVIMPGWPGGRGQTHCSLGPLAFSQVKNGHGCILPSASAVYCCSCFGSKLGASRLRCHDVRPSGSFRHQ